MTHLRGSALKEAVQVKNFSRLPKMFCVLAQINTTEHLAEPFAGLFHDALIERPSGAERYYKEAGLMP